VTGALNLIDLAGSERLHTAGTCILYNFLLFIRFLCLMHMHVDIHVRIHKHGLCKLWKAAYLRCICVFI